MSEVTAGQVACVAWNEHYAEQYGIEARNEWAASDPRGRGAWEAAASAGARDLRDAMAGLAAEMHAEADRIAPASSEPDGMPDIADQVRAQALHEYASRIRQALGPEAP